jgi:hypothetical protein
LLTLFTAEFFELLVVDNGRSKEEQRCIEGENERKAD